jgi:hypothetical protein
VLDDVVYSMFSVTVSRWYSPEDSGMIEIRWRICAALAGPTGIPATVAEPAVAEISVPRIRTVVVFPAPLRILCHLASGNRQLCHPAAHKLTEQRRSALAVGTEPGHIKTAGVLPT